MVILLLAPMLQLKQLPLTGTVDEINVLLNALKYQSDATFVGDDTLTIEVNDQGNTWCRVRC